MKMKTQLALSLASGVFCAAAFTQNADPPMVTLRNAKQEFNAQVEKARRALLGRYKEVLKWYADDGKLEQSLKVKDEMDQFESQGMLLGRFPEVSKNYSDYGRSMKSARDKLATAYEDAIRQYTKSQDLDKAAEAQKEYETLALKAPLNSLAAHRHRTSYVQHADYLGRVNKVVTDGDRLNATFELVPGLADRGAVSFRSVNIPNHYLAHGKFKVRLVRFEDTNGFRQNATFKEVKGLAAATASSFEAVNFPQHFIRLRSNGELYVDRNDRTVQFGSDATFVVLAPLFKLW